MNGAACKEQAFIILYTATRNGSKIIHHRWKFLLSAKIMKSKSSIAKVFYMLLLRCYFSYSQQTVSVGTMEYIAFHYLLHNTHNCNSSKVTCKTCLRAKVFLYGYSPYVCLSFFLFCGSKTLCQGLSPTFAWALFCGSRPFFQGFSPTFVWALFCGSRTSFQGSSSMFIWGLFCGTRTFC